MQMHTIASTIATHAHSSPDAECGIAFRIAAAAARVRPASGRSDSEEAGP